MASPLFFCRFQTEGLPAGCLSFAGRKHPIRSKLVVYVRLVWNCPWMQGVTATSQTHQLRSCHFHRPPRAAWARVCWNALAIRRCFESSVWRASCQMLKSVAKAEWFNPGGSVKDRAGSEHDSRRGWRQRRLAAGQDDSGRHQRQHRHRLRHDRRGAGLSA